VIAVLVSVALAASANTYCSPTGDLCYGASPARGGVVLRLTTIERYFGRYTLCVTSPRRTRVCGSFPIFRSGQVWESRVRWLRQFPNHGPGRYRVSWRLDGVPLGPTLGFRR
jgi:hypothetical protein